MCGRFTLRAEPDEVAEILPGLQVGAWPGPRYNIAPSQPVPTVLNESPRVLTWTRWGLIPAWAKDPQIGNRLINARAETLLEKPSFRVPFLRRRCLIVADGFYEWPQKVEGKPRTPVYFRLKGHRPFAFAGLWDRWQDPSGEVLTTCTIITTEPNDLVAVVHDRMPVILRPEWVERWLDPDVRDPETLMEALKPYPAEAMEAYPVSRLVNDPRVDSPECIRPIDYRP